MKPKEVQKLLKQLESDDPKARYEAVLKLGKTGNTELIVPLDKLANLDDNAKVRKLASQAVATLEELERRKLEKELQAFEETQGPDDGVEWKAMSSAKLFDQARFRSEEQLGEKQEWSYVESKKRHLRQMDEEERLRLEQEEADRIRREAAALRRRRPFRIFLYFMITLVMVLVLFAAWYQVFVDAAPSKQGEVLNELETTQQDQETAIRNLQTLLVTDPLDCGAMRGFVMPERPRWMGLRATTKSPQSTSGFFGGVADGMSQIDESLIADFVQIVDAVDETDAQFKLLKEVIDSACQGKDTLPLAEWPDFVQVASASDDVLLLSTATRSVIQNERIQVEPLTPEEAITRLTLWSDEQLKVAETYRDTLAADPVNCKILLQTALPQTPRWIASGQVDPLILGDLQDILNALADADGNLQGVNLGIGRICRVAENVSQADIGPAYQAIVDNNERALLSIDASRFVMGITEETATSEAP